MARPASTTRRVHPWDLAHDYASRSSMRSVAPVRFVEPDFEQRFVYETPQSRARSFSGSRDCARRGADPDWPSRPQFAWHLGEGFSQLASARALVGDPDGDRVRIGILDTGYDPAHSARPSRLLTDLQRDFFDDDPDAVDPEVGGLGNQPGHGTATLALLAGRRIRVPGTPGFDDFLGGAPHAEVVPIRIANSVIHFRTGSMAEGIEHAVASGCRVVSISMGGLPSSRWTDAVNAAYDAGVAIFAAAGNNLGGAPTRDIVWPARFDRVVAVCGATANKGPYFKRWFLGMQGNFGPPEKMETTVAAYTPNTPWAKIGCRDVISLDGGGTSSATPQAASAASLWLQRHPVPANTQPWQRVEAVRHALFASADKTPENRLRFFGQGLLRARNALDKPFDASRPKTPRDSVDFLLFREMTGFDTLPAARRRMLEVEAAQLAATSPEIIEVLPDPATPPERLSMSDRQRVVQILRTHPSASDALRQFVTTANP